MEYWFKTENSQLIIILTGAWRESLRAARVRANLAVVQATCPD